MISIYLECKKQNNEAFLFSLSNPHNEPPCRLMKLESSQYGIECNPEYGPIFGGEYYDIKITNDCNKEYSCSIFNDGSRGYECSPFYKISLFVNSAEPNKMNWFSVSDYEVYTFDYQCKYSVYHNCIQPDIIWEYINTKKIAPESLENVDETVVLKDLNTINCKDKEIRLMIGCIVKNHSLFIPESHLVGNEYDDYFTKWIDKINMKLVFRASSHGYKGTAFHKYCDNIQGPSLVIIKSSDGWIFGGYTEQSWDIESSTDKEGIYK